MVEVKQQIMVRTSNKWKTFDVIHAFPKFTSNFSCKRHLKQLKHLIVSDISESISVVQILSEEQISHLFYCRYFTHISYQNLHDFDSNFKNSVLQDRIHFGQTFKYLNKQSPDSHDVEAHEENV